MGSSTKPWDAEKFTCCWCGKKLHPVLFDHEEDGFKICMGCSVESVFMPTKRPWAAPPKKGE